MRSGPEVTPEAAVESIATDPTSLTLSSDITTASADVPVGGPTLEGRWARARNLYEVRTRFLVGGEVETTDQVDDEGVAE